MILLSFDIEEFDMPFEYGKEILFKDQIEISVKGTKHILAILKYHQIKATFFSTVIFAENAKELVQQIIDDGHELASHTYYHSKFEVSHLKSSREALEMLFKTEVKGLRMPRMMPVDETEVEQAGYVYNSSINPTWLPGRYNHLNKPRTFFKQRSVWQVPSSVSPLIRFPLFWLSFHNLPLNIYKWMAKTTYKQDGYLNLYFHPWEFTDLVAKERFGFPNYVSKNSGDKMISRMNSFIQYLQKSQFKFSTMIDFIENKK